MLKKISYRLAELPKYVYPILYLNWIQTFSLKSLNSFINIYVYVKTQTLFFLIIYQLIYEVGIFLGYAIGGYLLAKFQINTKISIILSMLLSLISSLVVVLFERSEQALILFSLINSVALGLFCIGTRTFEISYINDQNRDFYFSVDMAGRQVVMICIPFIFFISFIISDKTLHKDPFFLVFWLLTFCYSISIFFLNSIPKIIPPLLAFKEIINFKKNKKDNNVVQYYLYSSIYPLFIAIFVPFAAVIALKSIYNIGETGMIASQVSLLFTISMMNKRTKQNRVLFCFISIVGMSLSFYFLFNFDVSAYNYVIFSLLIVFFQPMFKISLNVLELHSLDFFKRTPEESPYLGLLYKEGLFLIGKMCFFAIIFCVLLITDNEIATTKIGVFVTFFSFLLLFYHSRLFLTKQKRIQLFSDSSVSSND